MHDLWFEELHDREEDIKPAHAETYQWILNFDSWGTGTSNFTDWLQSPYSLNAFDRIFWVSGKAGSGKSTLLKHLYHDRRLKLHLETWTRNLPLICAAFFIWDRGKSRMHKSRDGMARSLLHQILTENRRLAPFVLEERWKSSYENRPIEQALMIKRPPWTWAELTLALRRLTDESFLECHAASLRLFVLVDGLDEYRTFTDQDLPTNEVIRRKYEGYQELIVFFKELAKSPVAKLCLSSRPLTPFRDAFHLEGKEMKLEDLTYEDIKKYTNDVLGHNRRWADMCRHYASPAAALVDEIVEKALGVFLWVVIVVHLIMDGLQDGDTLQELQKTVNSLPVELGGVNGLYALMMKNIKVEHRRQCFEFIEVVKHSRRPQTTISLAQATGQSHDDLFTDLAQSPLLGDTELTHISNRMEDRITSRCAGILELVRNDQHPKINFIHQTAKEFVELPQTWDEHLPTFQKDFDSYLSLLKYCVLEFKQSYLRRKSSASLDVLWESVTDIVDDAMEYAYRSNPGDLPLPTFRTSGVHHTKAPKQTNGA